MMLTRTDLLSFRTRAIHPKSRWWGSEDKHRWKRLSSVSTVPKPSRYSATILRTRLLARPSPILRDNQRDPASLGSKGARIFMGWQPTWAAFRAGNKWWSYPKNSSTTPMHPIGSISAWIEEGKMWTFKGNGLRSPCTCWASRRLGSSSESSRLILRIFCPRPLKIN